MGVENEDDIYHLAKYFFATDDEKGKVTEIDRYIKNVYGCNFFNTLSEGLYDVLALKVSSLKVNLKQQ